MAAPKIPAGWELEEEPTAPKAQAGIPEGWELEEPAPVSDHVTSAAKTTAQDEATKNAYTKEKLLEGMLSFTSGGAPFMDELRGASAVMQPSGGPNGARPGEGPLDLYRRIRDSTRRDVDNATRRASPTVRLPSVISGEGEPVEGAPGLVRPRVDLPVLPLAGAVLPSVLAPNPATVLGRIGLSGATGAGYAAGESRADVTRGEGVKFLKDTGRGGAAGLVTGAGVEGVAAPMRALSRGGASRIGDVVATRAAKDAAEVDEIVKSLQGQARSATQVGSRYSENTLRAANAGVAPMGSSTLGPATQGRAIGMLADPDFKALMESVANNTMDEVPDQVRKIAAAKQAAAAAAANAPADAAKRTSDFFAKPTITTDVLPRIGRQFENAAASGLASLPNAAAMGVGSAFTGVGNPLTMAGLVAMHGAGKGLSKGALSAYRTTMANPRLQVGGLESLIRASQAVQKGAQTGARSAAAAGPQLREDEEEAIQAFLASP